MNPKYESTGSLFMDLLVACGLAAILYWLAPGVIQWLSTIPDPGEALIQAKFVPGAVSWEQLFISWRSLGVVMVIVFLMWIRGRRDVNVLRRLRWGAFGLIVIDLVFTGKPTPVELPPVLLGMIQFSMDLFKVLVREALIFVVSLAALVVVIGYLTKSLQIFMLFLQASLFLVLEFITGFVYGREELAILSAIGGFAAITHADLLVPDYDGTRNVSMTLFWALMMFVGVNVGAFLWLTWPYLVKFGVLNLQ